MRWKKLGKVFESRGQREWMASHSSVPMPEHIEGDVFRIYFSPRDAHQRSHIAYLHLDITEPQRVLDLCSAPVLAPGVPGAFDDSGAMNSWIAYHGGRRYLYYIGWTLGVVTPWRTAIGLALSDLTGDTPVFARYSTGPIIDRSPADPFFVTNPCVLVENGVWRMWYLSGLYWEIVSGNALPRYNVRYAESEDGIHWKCNGHVCIDHRHEGEVAIGRPCVLKDADGYKMWFSYRGDSFAYRMGYAESEDGLTWNRLDELAGLSPSETGWDCDAAYPTVFDHDGSRYMLYCGSQYSKAGFGLAVLEK